MHNRKNKNGFTLLEIMWVVLIISIIALLTVVFLGSSKDKAKRSKILSDLDLVRKSVEVYYNNGNYIDIVKQPLPSAIQQLATDINANGGQLNASVGNNSLDYVFYTIYPGSITNPSQHYWCIDSLGNSKDIGNYPASSCNATSGIKCPPGRICATF